MTTNEIILDQMIANTILVQRISNREANAIKRRLAAAEADLVGQLVARLERMRTLGVDHGPVRTARIKAMREVIQAVLSTVYADGYESLATNLEEFAAIEADQMRDLVEEAAPVQIGVTAPSTATLQGIVRSRPFQGRLLREWFRGLEEAQQRRIIEQIEIGLIEGEDIASIARRLRGTRTSKGVLDTGRRQAEAIVRTAVNHTMTRTRELFYEENASVIKGIMIVATLDLRTTPICRARDGDVHLPRKGPRPPFHIGCRTTTAVVTKSWRQLGIDLDEAPEGTRASLDGQVPASLNFNRWLRQQSDARQREALRLWQYKEFKRGVSVDRFVNAAGRELTNAEYKARKSALARRA